MLFQSGYTIPDLFCYAISGCFFRLDIMKKVLGTFFQVVKDSIDIRIRHGGLEDEIVAACAIYR